MSLLKNKFFKYVIVFIICGFLAFIIYNLVSKKNENKKDNKDDNEESITEKKTGNTKMLDIEIDGSKYKVLLEDNDTATDFYAITPIEFEMSDLNNNEKYYFLETFFEVAADYTGEIHTGDIMLYGNNCIVIFYKDFNTDIIYKKIGHIENLPNLGDESIYVKFVR